RCPQREPDAQAPARERIVLRRRLHTHDPDLARVVQVALPVATAGERLRAEHVVIITVEAHHLRRHTIQRETGAHLVVHARLRLRLLVGARARRAEAPVHPTEQPHARTRTETRADPGDQHVHVVLPHRRVPTLGIVPPVVRALEPDRLVPYPRRHRETPEVNTILHIDRNGVRFRDPVRLAPRRARTGPDHPPTHHLVGIVVMEPVLLVHVEPHAQLHIVPAARLEGEPQRALYALGHVVLVVGPHDQRARVA